MKNTMLIDIDTERKETVLIGKPSGFEMPDTSDERAQAVMTDMACLCEALCTLIHVAEQAGIKPSPDSLRDCIAHLTSGFAEAGYRGLITSAKSESKTKP